MNKEENFINTLFEKTEETEVVKPQTTEIVKMPMSSIVPNFKNPYKCREGLGKRTIYLQDEAGTAENAFTGIH